ncbi:MAG: ComF family protein [Treponema sp.]|nr:ComF family protein [Treponema sp.]
MISRTLFYLREFIFPSGCGGCRKALLSEEDAYYGICAECRAFAENSLYNEARCRCCNRILVSEIDVCLSCREPEDAHKARIKNENITIPRVLFPYSGTFKAILGAYKFGKSLGVGNYLAHHLNLTIDAIFNTLSGGFAAENAAIVPVPPRQGKLKKEGWDQIEYLAHLLERRNKRLFVCRCLKRLCSKSQKELNREQRGSNLKGRIVLTKPPPETVILFDDVITTGATIDACAKALLAGGTKKVYSVCLFYNQK